ncbi:MAG TPA: hypothetical protein VFX98_11005 [Longimicrobiaceae bacterium]|nr:hypothetical protein [Longimicrobiaceae bacterium]
MNKLNATVAVGGLLLVVGSGAYARSRPAQPTAADPNVVTIVATEFTFEAPDEIPAGLTTFKLVNRGQHLHHVQLVKLEDGKTAADYITALQAHGPPPSWAREVGGPNAPDPMGGEANATSVLEPGDYLLLCFVDMPDGVPHFVKGMIRPLRVTGAAAPPAAEPTADVRMRLDDYKFELSGPIAAGTRTIRVENGAAQPHEVELIRLAPGKTAADLMAWMQNMQGPPPASAIGGIAGMASGEHAYFTADFTPGDYVLICFIPDHKDGKPHFMHGMMQTIRVE